MIKLFIEPSYFFLIRSRRELETNCRNGTVSVLDVCIELFVHFPFCFSRFYQREYV